jgi:hypothetical protein
MLKLLTPNSRLSGFGENMKGRNGRRLDCREPLKLCSQGQNDAKTANAVRPTVGFRLKCETEKQATARLSGTAKTIFARPK